MKAWDLESVRYIVSEDKQFVTVVEYSGLTTLTNLMPYLSKHINQKENIDVLHIKYIDSEDEITFYNVKEDSYSPWDPRTS